MYQLLCSCIARMHIISRADVGRIQKHEHQQWKNRILQTQAHKHKHQARSLTDSSWMQMAARYCIAYPICTEAEISSWVDKHWTHMLWLVFPVHNQVTLHYITIKWHCTTLPCGLQHAHMMTRAAQWECWACLWWLWWWKQKWRIILICRISPDCHRLKVSLI